MSPPVADAHTESRWRPTHEKGSLDTVETGRSVDPSTMLEVPFARVITDVTPRPLIKDVAARLYATRYEQP
jgi:hypothetical protein